MNSDDSTRKALNISASADFFRSFSPYTFMCATKTKHVFVLFVIAVGNKTYINVEYVDKESEETCNV